MRVAAVLVMLAVGARALRIDEGDWWNRDGVEEDDEEWEEFTNSWVAQIQGGESVAKRVARDHGFTYGGLVESYDDHYRLLRDDHPELSTLNSKHLSRKLIGDDEVKWAEQEVLLKMQLRSARRNLEAQAYPYPAQPYYQGGYAAEEEEFADYEEEPVEDDYYPYDPYQQQELNDAGRKEGRFFGASQLGRPGRYGQPVTIWSNDDDVADDDDVEDVDEDDDDVDDDVDDDDYYDDDYDEYQLSYMKTGRPPKGTSRQPNTYYYNTDDDLDALTSQLQHSLWVLTSGSPLNSHPRPRPLPSSYLDYQNEYVYRPPPYTKLPLSSELPQGMLSRPYSPNQMYDPSPYLRPPPQVRPLPYSSPPTYEHTPYIRPPAPVPPPSALPPPQVKPLPHSPLPTYEPTHYIRPPTYAPPPTTLPPPQVNPLPYSPLPTYEPTPYIRPPTYAPPPTALPPPQVKPLPHSPLPTYEPTPYIRPPPTYVHPPSALPPPEVRPPPSTPPPTYKPPPPSPPPQVQPPPNSPPPSQEMADLHNAKAAKQGDLSKLGTFGTAPMDAGVLSSYTGVTPSVEQLSVKTSAYKDQFTDPLWKKQWYCHDYRTVKGPVMDHNVVPVYNMGYTGQGVKVAVVDDGCELHADLLPNMMKRLNYDMSSRRPGATPEPGTSHGTRCAGEIAMAANNGLCGVGIAYGCKFAAVKKVGGMTLSYVEGSALAYKPEVFDIYSNSWGPEDDGVYMNEAAHLNVKALSTGYFEGRGGKGVLYTFAGGNGRHKDDNCAADEFVNNLYAFGIAAVTQRGKIAYYSERCTGVLATTYSGGDSLDERVASTDIGGGCTTAFSGSSAAVPIATGIFALVFSANKELFARDITHLTALSAEVAPLADNPDTWYRNGAGFWVSNDFGFGLFNAENMVKLAKKWKPVGDRHACEVKIKIKEPMLLSIEKDIVINFHSTGCSETPEFHVSSLEEVMLKTEIEYPYRGAISIHLTSPMKTKSLILQTRPKDNFNKLIWEFKSFHNWGENPTGKWLIEVKANQLPGVKAGSGHALEFSVILFGTAQKPWYHAQGLVPRKYSAFRLSNGQTG